MTDEAADGICPGTRLLREVNAMSTPASVTANTGITVLGSCGGGVGPGGTRRMSGESSHAPGSVPVGMTVRPMISSRSMGPGLCLIVPVSSRPCMAAVGVNISSGEGVAP